MRRLFGNLASNVRKYEAPVKPVILTVRVENGGLLSRKTNGIGRILVAASLVIGLVNAFMV